MGGGYGGELLGGRYRLVEQIGAGGMSVVWRGYDEVLDREVAVKVLAPRLATDGAFRSRIRAEAQAAARLSHPHITNVYDYGEAVRANVPVPYVVMELVDGEPLAARLSRHPLPWREAVVACAEVAAALAAAHARGVAHRDVTPGNVMLTPTGAKVVDFGISALIGENDTGADGTLLGTPAYLAPERLDAGQVSPATDVYAVGVLLYRALTNRLPWQAATTTQVLRAHRYARPAPLPDLDGMPAEVTELCRRCLAKSPADRPTSAQLAGGLAALAGRAGAIPVSPAPTGGYARGATTGGTVPLPRVTEELPLSGEPGLPAGADGVAPGRRRRRVAAVAAAALGITGLVWVTAGAAPVGKRGAADGSGAAGMAVRPPTRCVVDYRVRAEPGQRFAADLHITNMAAQPQRNWTLAFVFPGSQSVTGSASAVWTQRGRQVAIRPEPAGKDLPPGGSATVRLTGRHHGDHRLPVTFQLNGATCEARLTAAAAPPGAAPVAGFGSTVDRPEDRGGPESGRDDDPKPKPGHGPERSKGNGPKNRD